MHQAFLRIDTARPLPTRVDVAIIGGGAAGIATAHELHKLGLQVAVFEKGLVAAEQSSRNWGWCRTLGRNVNELEIAKLSVDIWRGLGAEIGADVGFRQSGVLFVTDSEKEMALWERWQKMAARGGVDARLLCAEETNRSYAWSGKPWIGGIVNDSDGYAEPSRAIPLLAQYLVARGVHISQECAVDELYLEAGKIAGVVTERGTVKASAVVLAGGAWSSLFCRKHKLPLPVLNVHSGASKTRAVDFGGVGPATRATEFSFRFRDDGGLTLAKSGRGTVHAVPDCLRYGWKFRDLYRARRANVGVSFGPRFFRQWLMEFRYIHLGRSPFSANRILDPAPDMDLIESAYDEAAKMFPEVSKRDLDFAWGGVIDNTPDSVPVVSAIGKMPGLYLCTGFSGHGFSSSMGAGRSLAQLIVHGRSELALGAFSYDRLVDGSKLSASILY